MKPKPKSKAYYPTVKDVIETNQGIVSSDIDKIKKELENSELTQEEKDYLERLLKWKQHALKHPFRDPKNDGIRNKLMEEGEKWHRRKDKHFDLDYDVLTD